MKIIYLLIGIACTIIIPSNSYSQETKDKVETELLCYDTKEIFKSLKEKYKEFPILTGKVNDFANSTVSVWMNPTEKNWTIVATKKDITCVIGSGTDMNLMSYKKGTDI